MISAISVVCRRLLDVLKSKFLNFDEDVMLLVTKKVYNIHRCNIYRRDKSVPSAKCVRAPAVHKYEASHSLHPV